MQEDANCLLENYEKIKTSAEFSALVSAYEEQGAAFDFSPALQRLKSISVSVGVHEYTAAMLYFLCLTREWRRLCACQKIDDDVWHDSAMDLKYKLWECKAVKGVVGTFVGAWFPRFFKLERFALGRLQFETIVLGEECRLNGKVLSSGTTVLNVHIPRTGMRLIYEEVCEAYQKARVFFRQKFAFETPAFVCHSWLLYPLHQKMLSNDSNILKFINDYTLVKTGQYDNYSELWRLFDCEIKEDFGLLPQDTSLRREYVSLMLRKEKSGWGFGVHMCI